MYLLQKLVESDKAVNAMRGKYLHEVRASRRLLLLRFLQVHDLWPDHPSRALSYLYGCSLLKVQTGDCRGAASAD